jgi:hypothetical protein
MKTFYTNGLPYEIDDRIEMYKELSVDVENAITDLILDFVKCENQAEKALKNLTYLVMAERVGNDSIDCILEDENNKIAGLLFVSDPDDADYLIAIVQDNVSYKYVLYSLWCYDCNESIERFELEEYTEEEEEDPWFYPEDYDD